jgi:Spy/CpxP family protein refolding chaperone
MKRILLLTMAAALLLVPVAVAQPGAGPGPGAGQNCAPGCNNGPAFGFRSHGGHQGFGMGLMACKAELNLTDEQVAKIKAVNLDHQTEMIDFRADLAKLRATKHNEMTSDNPDRAKVLELTKEMNAVRGKIAVAQVSHMFAVRDILTPEQLKKWKNCRMNDRGPGMRGMDSGKCGQGFRGKG